MADSSSRWDKPEFDMSAPNPFGAGADSDMGGFDFGGMNMSDIMAQAQAMQAQIANAQAELSTMTFTGTAGGGLVSVIVSGTGELEKVAIKPEACDPSDTESLGDLVVAAVRDAQNQMAAVAQAKLGVAGGGMGF